jgi:hypothetical protein
MCPLIRRGQSCAVDAVLPAGEREAVKEAQCAKRLPIHRCGRVRSSESVEIAPPMVTKP